MYKEDLTMVKENAGIVIFNTHVEAESAVKELQKSVFERSS